MTDHNADKKPKEQTHPAKEAPNEQGEIPRSRDDSKDDKQDPYQKK